MSDVAGLVRGLAPKDWVRLARWLTVGVAGGALAYLGVRFDLLTLPEEGCSPVSRYAPGSRLLIDRWGGAWREGDCVFVSDEDGAIHITLLTAHDGGGKWWTSTDVEDCPGVDPEAIGWVPEEAILGRVILGLGQ